VQPAQLAVMQLRKACVAGLLFLAAHWETHVDGIEAQG
jgi:hypothetical protein